MALGSTTASAVGSSSSSSSGSLPPSLPTPTTRFGTHSLSLLPDTCQSGGGGGGGGDGNGGRILLSTSVGGSSETSAIASSVSNVISSKHYPQPKTWSPDSTQPSSLPLIRRRNSRRNSLSHSLFRSIPDSTTTFGVGSSVRPCSIGAALYPPPPHDAPALTLSYRSAPHPSQFPSFASLIPSLIDTEISLASSLPPASSTKGLQSSSAPPPSSSSLSSSSAAAPPPPPTPSIPNQSSAASTSVNNTPAPSFTSTHPSSPATAEPPDLAASILTEATSIAENDASFKFGASSTLTESSSSTTSPGMPSATAPSKTPAWGAPKSWAELASRGTNDASSAKMPIGISVNVNESSAADISQADSHSPKNSNRRKSGAQADSKRTTTSQQSSSHPQILSLDRLLADSHTQFNAPLVHPRGLVNNGNFCFANAILQMLVYCAPFYNLFSLIKKEIPADFANSTPLMEAVIHFFREFHLVDSNTDSDRSNLSNAFNPALCEPFVPEFVYDAMRLNKRFDQMRRGHQEDAEEFLGFFLDTLHEELLFAIRRSAMRLVHPGSGAHSLLASMTDEEKKLNGVTTQGLQTGKGGVNANNATPLAGAADGLGLGLDGGQDQIEERELVRPVSPTEQGWMEVGQKGKTAFTRTTSTSESPITRIFGGKLRSVLKTPGAKDSVTLEPYQPLQLDIQPDHVQSVEDALLNLTMPETIPGVFSPARGTVVDATKQVFIESLPPVLILHLKRFVYDEVGGVQKSQKPLAYGTTLEIATQVLSPTMRTQAKPRYRLFGVVYHHGRYASGGHYTVDVLRQDGESWLHIDDTVFQTIPTEHVVRTVNSTLHDGSKKPSLPTDHDGLAYLLFYRKETQDKPNDASSSPASTLSSAVTGAPNGIHSHPPLHSRNASAINFNSKNLDSSRASSKMIQVKPQNSQSGNTTRTQQQQQQKHNKPPLASKQAKSTSASNTTSKPSPTQQQPPKRTVPGWIK